jgi:hypothetical protein
MLAIPINEEESMSRKKTDGNRYACGRVSAILLSLLLFIVGSVRGAVVDSDSAREFATNWLSAAGDGLWSGVREVGDIDSLLDADGKVVAYVVGLRPAGYLVLSTDDRISPVIAMSRSGSFDNAAGNPLRSMLLADLGKRLLEAEAVAPEGQTRGGSTVPAGIAANKSAWGKFLGGKTRGSGTDVVSEVWVGPLMKSKWSQGNGIYNYYTPKINANDYTMYEYGNPENAVCGCVATMAGQLMYYFQWPQKPIGKVLGSCEITFADEIVHPDAKPVQMYLYGGDRQGGAYKWDLMKPVPTANEDPATYEQIGALLLDAGLSVNMGYSNSGSEAVTSRVSGALRNAFKYAYAKPLGADYNSARANLDARRPLGVSIRGVEEDHAIVCDGYGRLDGRWYYHMNFGWAGSQDLWYSWEENFTPGSSIYLTGFSFGVGNIYRQKLQANEHMQGHIISGRVTDANGNPVAGVKVSIRKAGESETWQTMLAWYDPIDPVATPIYQDWDKAGNFNGIWEASELPGADKYRNTTDSWGIWAIDKVEAGDYEIVLEKDGLQFSGKKVVNVSRNIWGINFVASTEDNLALTKWWNEGDLYYFQFNRAVGNVDLDLNKISINGKTLGQYGAVVSMSSASNLIVIQASLPADGTGGDLVVNDGFLTPVYPNILNWFWGDGKTLMVEFTDVISSELAAAWDASDFRAFTGLTINGVDLSNARAVRYSPAVDEYELGSKLVVIDISNCPNTGAVATETTHAADTFAYTGTGLSMPVSFLSSKEFGWLDFDKNLGYAGIDYSKVVLSNRTLEGAVELHRQPYSDYVILNVKSLVEFTDDQATIADADKGSFILADVPALSEEESDWTEAEGKVTLTFAGNLGYVEQVDLSKVTFDERALTGATVTSTVPFGKTIDIDTSALTNLAGDATIAAGGLVDHAPAYVENLAEVGTYAVIKFNQIPGEGVFNFARFCIKTAEGVYNDLAGAGIVFSSPLCDYVIVDLKSVAFKEDKKVTSSAGAFTATKGGAAVEGLAVDTFNISGDTITLTFNKDFDELTVDPTKVEYNGVTLRYTADASDTTAVAGTSITLKNIWFLQSDIALTVGFHSGNADIQVDADGWAANAAKFDKDADTSLIFLKYAKALGTVKELNSVAGASIHANFPYSDILPLKVTEAWLNDGANNLGNDDFLVYDELQPASWALEDNNTRLVLTFNRNFSTIELDPTKVSIGTVALAGSILDYAMEGSNQAIINVSKITKLSKPIALAAGFLTYPADIVQSITRVGNIVTVTFIRDIAAEDLGKIKIGDRGLAGADLTRADNVLTVDITPLTKLEGNFGEGTLEPADTSYAIAPVLERDADKDEVVDLGGGQRQYHIWYKSDVGYVALDRSKASYAGVELTAATISKEGPKTLEIILETGSGLAFAEGAMTIDPDGSSNSDQPNMWDMTIVDVTPAVSGVGATTEIPAASIVTSIKRAFDKFYVNTPVLEFTVTGSDLASIKVTDWQVRSTSSGKAATVPPRATITEWDATNGILKVQVSDGDGLVKVDYVPDEGTPFVNGEVYHFDNVGPVIIAATLDRSNRFVDVTWNEVIGALGEGVNEESLEGKSAIGGKYVYAYQDNAGEPAIWREAPSQVGDGKYTSNADRAITGCVGLADNTNGNLLDKVSVRVGGFNVPAARFMLIDDNGNDLYDEGEVIFLKMRNDMQEILDNMDDGFWMADYIGTLLNPGDDKFDENYSAASSSYDSLLVLQGVAPTRDYDTGVKACFGLPNKMYSSVAPPVPATTDPQVLLAQIKGWWTNLGKEGAGAWQDFGVPVIGTFDLAAGDELILGAPTGAAGEALPANIMYFDFDCNGYLSAGDFIWIDGENDLTFTRGNAADVVISRVQEDDLNWNLAPVNHEDFEVILHRNNGTVINVFVEAVTNVGETDKTLVLTSANVNQVRIWLKYTPELEIEGTVALPETADDLTTDMEELSILKVPAGVETIEIRPRGNQENTLYDALENEVSASNTTGEMLLFDTSRPRVTNVIVGHDNYSVQIVFNKRIYGNNQGILQNYADAAPFFPRFHDWEIVDHTNFDVKVVYDNGKELPVSLRNTAAFQNVKYQRGSNMVLLDFNGNYNNEHLLDATRGNPGALWTTAELAADASRSNPAKLSCSYEGNAFEYTVYPKPVKVVINFLNIFDYQTNPLADERIEATLWPAYKPGYPSLVPPMFSSYKERLTVSFNVTNSNSGTSWTYGWVDGLGMCGIYKDWSTTQTTYTFHRGAYTQPQLTDEAKQLYTTYTDNEKYQLRDVLGPGAEQGDADGITYYGIWYRDLDGDGRVDAVDLNFKNPYVTNINRAELRVGGEAISGFKVWVQHNDPDDIENATHEGYYPPNTEYGNDFSVFMNWTSFPANTAGNRGTMETFHNHSTSNWLSNWRSVSITGHQLIPNTSSTSWGYTTLRLNLDQSQIPARTYGNRWIAVSYRAPNYSDRRTDTGERWSNTYDWRRSNNLPLVRPSDNKYNVPIANATIQGRFTSADELAGLCWVWPRTNINYHTGHVDAHFICDSFGPVMAWDGAAPVPMTAVAWRATPYIKSDETEMGYEYLDVKFTEPMAYVNDNSIPGVGYLETQLTPVGALYGAWGAEVIDTNTVRFRFRSSTTNLEHTFNANWLYELGSGLIEQRGMASTTPYRTNREFSVRAIGVRPVDSRYRILTQGTGDLVPMFTVDANGASVTGRGPGSSTTTNLSVNEVLLKTVEQGGAYSFGTASWYENGARIGNANAQNIRGNLSSRGTLVYSLGANNLAPGINPGSGLYGGIARLIVRNDNYAGYAQGRYNVGSRGTMRAPDPMNRGYGYTTALTPDQMMMVGPVYNMVKVSPVQQAYNTSRIQAETRTRVLGIDAGGASQYSLTAVTVRAIDTSYGQFDPEIDFEKLADGITSGVQLIRADGSTVTVSMNGLEWSGWKVTEEGLPYKEVTLRPASPEAIPTTGGPERSFDFYIQVLTSSDFNLGDNFIIEIPDDGIAFGTYSTQDKHVATWGTANGTRGFAFTDHIFNDTNNDGRWSADAAITSFEDIFYRTPLYDGGRPYITNWQRTKILAQNGINVKNLYYAKKDWSTNPETSPFYGFGNLTSTADHMWMLVDMLGSSGFDLNYNVSYAPGDDIWYDIGGTPGVYDAGIDIPLFGNADKFPLPWSVSESGARSAQYRNAATAKVNAVMGANERYISAPSGAPVAVVGLDMQDAGRGFGPRYILNESVLVETISKNMVAGPHSLVFTADGKASWDGGEPVAVPTEVGGRAILLDATKAYAVVIRRLNAALPAADTSEQFIVSADIDRDIQQPVEIEGVRIHAVGRGDAITNVPNQKYVLRRNGTSLSWDGGAYVDTAAGGTFVLNPDAANYLIVQVDALGMNGTGSESEELEVYAADGRVITPFLNITGLEVMSVSDMVAQGSYVFSYDGGGNFTWGSGDPIDVKSLAVGEYAIAFGDGVSPDYPRNFVVVRRTAGSLPSQAVTDSLFINQTQLLRVAVSVTNVRGFTNTHLKPLTADKESGISLWWDANADGQYNAGDMFVPLAEVPVLVGGGSNRYDTVLTPDPAFLTAWLSCPQDASYSKRGSNFFVCVQTTVDMSYGDQFAVSASFYEPTEPDYVTGGVCFASGGSGTITCTSITNTQFRKLTTPGQTADAGNTVPLASIDHFLGADLGRPAFMESVTITFYSASASFDPDKIFKPMTGVDTADAGLVLYADNGNGVWERWDTAVACSIIADEANGTDGWWKYTLRPTNTPGNGSDVPVAEDNGRADHYLVINLSDELPYGVQFYARMEIDAINYNTGEGSAAAVMITDILNSTINSKFDDVLNATMITPGNGLVINKVGANVQNAYHDITFGYNPRTNKYSLTWNGETIEVDPTKVGTYTFGTGEDGITVTFDPLALFREDTIVSGVVPETLELGAKLLDLEDNDFLTYYDVNANGRYDDYEPIASGPMMVYGDVDPALCTTKFTAADGLSYFDEDGNGEYTLGELILRDSDNVYTLPWMDHFLDIDNFQTVGPGNSAPNIDQDMLLVDAATISPAAGTPVTPGLYLYYIDRVDDQRGYVYGEDILVARQAVMGAMPELTFGDRDKVVLDLSFDLEGEEEYVNPAVGTVLKQFLTSDYLRFRMAGDEARYEEGEALFLSVDEAYSAPSYTWTIRIDGTRVIRRYNADAPAPYNEARFALSSIIGLDLANSGAAEVLLTGLTVRFRDVQNFTRSDLRDLTADIESGVQLWRDQDGNGIFNPDIDKLVSLNRAPVWTSDGTDISLTFSPSGGNQISNPDVDGLYDFFVVVQPSEKANNTEANNNGDKFRIEIRNSDIRLNKTVNQTVAITTAAVTIDSQAPALVAEATIVDNDGDGYVETLTMVFDERLQPYKLDDLSIWNITDMATGKPLTATNAELSDDYLQVTVTFTGCDKGTTTGAMKLGVNYNEKTGLLDWAGNPVDFRDAETGDFIATGDTVAPIIVHTGVVYSTNGFDDNTVTPFAMADRNGIFFFDRNNDGEWTEGEDVFIALKDANDPSEAAIVGLYMNKIDRLWNGGGAWTTPLNSEGVLLGDIYFCDANGNGTWDRGEFIWIERTEVVALEPGEDPEPITFDAASGDIEIPANRTEELQVLDVDGNGKLDAIAVEFSEAVIDSTMRGFDANASSYVPVQWTLSGRTGLKAWKQGYKKVDAQNNEFIMFSFDEAADADTGSIPASLAVSSETLADENGNRLNRGNAYQASGINKLVLADQAAPILLSIVSSNRVAEDGTLPAGTVFTLTFSEPLVQYLDILEAYNDFQIKRNDVLPYQVLADCGVTDIAVEGAVMTLTFGADTADWAANGVLFEVKDNAKSAFGDAVGHALKAVADLPIEGLSTEDPVRFIAPVAGQYIRNDSDDLAVKVYFGDLDPANVEIVSWNLVLNNGVEEFELEGFDEASLAIVTDDTADFTAWSIDGIYQYKLTLTLVLANGDTNETECTFFYSKQDDIFSVGIAVNDGAGNDIDEMLPQAPPADLFANWSDFSAQNGFPPASYYTLKYTRDDMVPTDDAKVINDTIGFFTVDDLILGVTYTATVTAFDENDVALAQATSDGFTVVDVLTDVTAPVVGNVENTDENWNEIQVTDKSDQLNAKWVADDDIGVTGYKYRIVLGVDTAVWSEDSNGLSSSREDFASVVMNDKAYAIGGFDGGEGKSLSSVDVYDSATRSWIKAAQSLKEARSDFAFVDLGNGKLMVFGGTNNGALSSIEAFDGTSWRIVGNLPEACYNAKAVKVSDDKVWIIGGTDANDGMMSEIYEYTVSTGGIVKVADLSVARINFQAAVQRQNNGNVVVVAGGADSRGNASSQVEIYNIANAQRVIRNLNQGRQSFAMVVVPSADNTTDDIWFIGGEDSNHDPLASVEVMKASGDIQNLAPLSYARTNLAAAWLPEFERVIVTGGIYEDDELTEENELVQTELAVRDGNEWVLGSEMVTVAGRQGHQLAVCGNRIVAFGGKSDTSFVKKTESRIVIDVVKDWVDTTENQVEVTGLALENGNTYVFEVKAVDAAGNWSAIKSSKGVLVDTAVPVATISSADLPANGGSTYLDDFEITIGGYKITEYKYSLDGGAWSEWIGIATKIILTDLPAGAHTLKVCGKRTEGVVSEQAEENATVYTWSTGVPYVKINNPLDPNVTVLSHDFEIFCHLAEGYKWQLSRKSPDMADFDIVTAFGVAKPAGEILSLNFNAGYTYKLEVKGIYGDELETSTDSCVWTVKATGIVLTSAAINGQGNPVAYGTLVDITVEDASGLNSIDLYKFAIVDEDNNVILGGDDVEHDIADKITIDTPLPLGTYTVQAVGRQNGVWDANPTTATFTIAEATIDTTGLPTEPTVTTNFTIPIVMNGLAQLQWQIDDGAEELVDAQDTLEVGPFGVGKHTVKIWGVDYNGTVQANASEVELIVKSPLPIGDNRLVGMITAVESQPVAGGDIEFTLTMSDALMANPRPEHFMVQNGTIVDIEIDALQATKYVVTVQPDLGAADAATVSLQLLAQKVVDVTNGLYNVATNVCKVLVYSDVLLTFTPVATPDAGLTIYQEFTVDVMVEAETAFRGGDILVTFDGALYELQAEQAVDGDGNPVFDEKGNALPDAKSLFVAPFNSLGCVAEWIYDVNDDIIGLRIGGSVASAAASAEPVKYASLTFKALAETADGEIELAGYADGAGLLLDPYGIVPGDSAAVVYNTVVVPVAFAKSQLSIAIAPATVTEGEGADYELTLSLSYALDSDIEVTVGALDPITILAGETTWSQTFTAANNAELFGDTTNVFEVTAVAGHADVEIAVGLDTATIEILESDWALTFEALTNDADRAPLTEVTAGDTFILRVSLADGVTASGDAKIKLVLGGTAIADTEYLINKTITIADGENSAEILVTTYADTIAEDKTIELGASSITAGGALENAVSLFQAPTPVVVNVLYKPMIAGDVNNDGEVTLSDLILLMNYYDSGITAGDEEWDAYAAASDLSPIGAPDGVIDYNDLIIFLNYLPNDATRGGKTRGDAPEFINVAFTIEADKTEVAPGDVITITIKALTDTTQYAIGTILANVNFDNALFGIDGVFAPADYINPEFNLIQNGWLAENGIEELGGTGLKTTMGTKGEFIFATIPLKVADKLTGSQAMFSLDKFNIGVNGAPYATERGNIIATCEPLILNIAQEGDVADIPEFKFGFTRSYGTRGAAEELELGMADGATIGYDEGLDKMWMAWPGAPEMPANYEIAFTAPGREEALKTDIRAKADKDIWNVEVFVPAGQKLTLDWNINLNDATGEYSMPDYFTFTLVKADNSEIDMRTIKTKRITFDGGVIEPGLITTFKVVLSKADDGTVPPDPEVFDWTYRLYPGWNLIGAPFDFDEASNAKFKNFDLMAFNSNTQSYTYMINEFKAGMGVWVFVEADQMGSNNVLEIGVNAAAYSTETSIAIKAGWNLVTPLYMQNANYADPTGNGIETVWYWEADGYLKVVKDADVKVGKGYWIYSDRDTTIWPTN